MVTSTRGNSTRSSRGSNFHGAGDHALFQPALDPREACRTARQPAFRAPSRSARGRPLTSGRRDMRSRWPFSRWWPRGSFPGSSSSYCGRGGSGAACILSAAEFSSPGSTGEGGPTGRRGRHAGIDFPDAFAFSFPPDERPDRRGGGPPFSSRIPPDNQDLKRWEPIRISSNPEADRMASISLRLWAFSHNPCRIALPICAKRRNRDRRAVMNTAFLPVRCDPQGGEKRRGGPPGIRERRRRRRPYRIPRGPSFHTSCGRSTAPSLQTSIPTSVSVSRPRNKQTSSKTLRSRSSAGPYTYTSTVSSETRSASALVYIIDARASARE